jgi:hemerythrin-like domain-containing protein
MPVIAFVAPGPEVTSTTPGTAGAARIAVGRVRGSLLVAHQHVRQIAAVLEQRVVDMKNGAPRIAEDVLDAFVLERLDDHFTARQQFHVDTPP